MTTEQLMDYIQNRFDIALEAALNELVGRMNEELGTDFYSYFQGLIREEMPDALNNAIQIFFVEHCFKFPDGTTVESSKRMKILSPDKKKLVTYYGGLNIKELDNGKWALIAQTGYDRWEIVAEYQTDDDAVDALLAVNNAMDSGNCKTFEL